MRRTGAQGKRPRIDGRKCLTPDGVFRLRMDDELRIKRVQRVAGGAWVLISDNSAYERGLVQPEDVEIIGQCWRKVGRVF